MDIVIINCFDTYEHRVDLLCDVFIDEGHNVEVLTSDYMHFEKKYRSEMKNHFKFFHAKQYKKNLSVSRLNSHTKLSRDISKYLNERDVPDLIWVLIPPNSFVKDIARYKESHINTKLVFDLIDLWPETMPIGSLKNIFPFTIWKGLRDNYLKFADYIVTECDLYKKKLNDVIGSIPTSTLYLARPYIPLEPHLNLPDDRINLCYLGSINNIIDIDRIGMIIKEFKILKPVELHIVGDGENRDRLINVAEESGASVVFHGSIYIRDEKQKVFDMCHYGLNIMKDTVCVGLTMKSIDYMEFGVPIINNINGDTWDVIERFNIGYNEVPSIDDYDLSQRHNSRKFFEDNFTSDIFRHKVLSIIEA